MARIATKTAKPNGQYYITPEMVRFGVCCYLDVCLDILQVVYCSMV